MVEVIMGTNWMKVYAISSLIFFISMEINYISEIFTIISKLIGISVKEDYFKTIVYFILTILFEIVICFYLSNIKKIHITPYDIFFFNYILYSDFNFSYCPWLY